MTRLLRFAGIAAALLLAAYFVYFAVRTLQEYDLGALMEPRLFLATAAAALLYAMIIPISGWAWAVLLQGGGQSWSMAHLAVIMGLTQLAKYVPGNLGQHIGRMVLSLSKGMPAEHYVSSVFVETWLATSAGLMVGVAFVMLSPVATSPVLLEYRAILIGIAVSLVLVALFLPWLLAILTGLLRRFNLTSSSDGSALASPGFPAMMRAFLAYSLNYLLIGLGVWLIASAVDADIITDYLYLTGAFALSWLVGFLTPGAPAGLGVREGAIVLLLAGTGTSDAVLVITAAMRIATMAGDAVCFSASALFLRYFPIRGANESAA